MTASILLAGAWPLAHVLVARAGRLRVSVERVPPAAGPATLFWHNGSRELPDLDGIAAEMCGYLVGRLIDGFDTAPRAITGTVLVPAAGVCGPAGRGPVDAIRIGDDLTPSARVPVSLRLLHTQQTRLWLLVADCHGVSGVWRPAPEEIVLPRAIAADTARAAEYPHDAALGPDWPGIVHFGHPVPVPGGGVRAVLAASEVGYVDAMLAVVAGTEAVPVA